MAAAAALLLAVLAAGCSNGDGDGGGDGKESKPSASASRPASPSLSQTEAREACVDAWADALLEDPELGVDQEPAECAGLSADDRLDRYMEGLQQRNEINRG
ncbi:hypothetical protein [Streptomyces sp. NPDC048188]|uniref:hypothetical protein n=1 Tax=Streptomyces sp. NPDC048188 TaxID=3155749 RepID=UPI00344A7F79